MVSFALFSSFSGFLLGRGIGRPETILISALLAAGIIIGFIGVVPSFWGLVVFMVVIGGSGGIVESTGTMLLSHADPNPNGRYVHISQLFYCVGALFAPMIIGILLAGNISIALIGLAVGLLTITIALVVLSLLFRGGHGPGRYRGAGKIDGPAMVREQEGVRGELASGGSPGAGAFCEAEATVAPVIPTAVPVVHGIAGVSGEVEHVGRVHKDRDGILGQRADAPALGLFIWFLLVMFFYVMLEISVASWLPAFLETTFSVSPAHASLHLTLFWSGLAATRFLYIFITSRAIRFQLAVHILGIFLSVLILLLFSGFSVVRSTAVFVFGLACGPVWPLIVNLYSRMFVRQHYIMYLVSSGSVGGLVGILITSGVVEFLGTGSLPAVVAVYAVLLAVVFAVLAGKLRQG
jgi:fucose permease